MKNVKIIYVSGNSASSLFPLKLSGTEILDAIENETSGTLKKCYIALGQLKPPPVLQKTHICEKRLKAHLYRSESR